MVNKLMDWAQVYFFLIRPRLPVLLIYISIYYVKYIPTSRLHVQFKSLDSLEPTLYQFKEKKNVEPNYDCSLKKNYPCPISRSITTNKAIDDLHT